MTEEIAVSEYKNINVIHEKIQKNTKMKKLFSDKYTNFSKDKFISRREYRVLKKIGKYFDYLQEQNINNKLKIQDEALKKDYIEDMKRKI